jgi:general stress protein YciG
MGTKTRGFASMTPARQREIASMGGVAAHRKGTAHEWNATEAAKAGKKGGEVSRGGRGKLPTRQQQIEAQLAGEGEE